ncbi:4372_t:CDS:1, partial [Entrophospora sp. SA101]
CLKQSNINTVITGVSKPEQIYENINAVGLAPKLTAEILGEIELILDNKPPIPFNFRDS